MAASKPDLSEACSTLRERRSWRNLKRTKRLEIYTESLVLRFRTIQHVYCAICRVRESVLGITASTSAEVFTPTEQLSYYTNSFWAFAYSIFDILANVINVVYPMSTDESKVSFVQAAKDYVQLTAGVRTKRKHLPSAVLQQIRRTMADDTFKRLYGYRQCCLHRREVCFSKATVPEIVPGPYHIATTAPNEPKPILLVCDDPQSINPSFDLRRELLEECEAVGKFVKREAVAIVKKL